MEPNNDFRFLENITASAIILSRIDLIKEINYMIVAYSLVYIMEH